METKSIIRLVVIVDIIVFAAVAGFVLFKFMPGDGDDVAGGNDVPGSLLSFGTDSWEIFRGDCSLTGVAQGTLPESLKLSWKFKTGDAIVSSAVISDGKVFIGSNDTKLYAVSLDKGTEIWNFKTDDYVEAAPMYIDGIVVVGSVDTFIYAVDAQSGKLKWKYETADKVVGSANIYSPEKGNKNIIFGSYDNSLYCFDIAGNKLWAYETDSYINGSPAVWQDKAAIGGCDALIHIVDLSKGQQAGQVDAQAYVASSGLIEDGRLYVGNYEGIFMCIDMNEAKTLWNQEKVESPFLSSPALTDKFVLVGAQDNKLHAMDKNTGDIAWSFTTQGQIDSSPVVAGSRAVFGSADGRLYIISAEDGSEVWSYEIGSGIMSSPAIADNTVVVGAEDGYVYAFRVK